MQVNESLFVLKYNQLKSRGADTGRELLNNHDNGVEDNLTNVQGLVGAGAEDQPRLRGQNWTFEKAFLLCLY